MKKVWILEKFEKPEITQKHIEEYEQMLQMAKQNGTPEESIKALESVIDRQKELLGENPEGRWFGFEGKFYYQHFVQVARAAIKRNPDGIFRVVKAEIDDDAIYWCGYQNPEVNNGVLGYLKATL